MCLLTLFFLLLLLFFLANDNETQMAEEISRLQTELAAAKEQNVQWQEINNQMYRHMFTVLRDPNNNSAPSDSQPMG